LSVDATKHASENTEARLAIKVNWLMPLSFYTVSGR